MMNLMGIKVEPVVKPKVDDSALAKLDYSGIAGLGKVKGKGAEAKAKKDPAIAMAKQVATDTLKAQKDYQSAVLKAQADYQKTVIDRMKEFTQKFEDAVKVDVSALFNEGYQSAELLIEGMKAKLASAKTFADDIAKLSAMNYSEEFLNQIMSLGPVMGNQMATMLLSGAPEVQEEIKSLFSESQLISKTGVDGVAKSLIPTFTDATTRLGNAMVEAANSLSTALNKIKNITPEQIVGATKGAKVLATTPTNAGGKGGLVVNTNVVNAGAGANEIASSVVNAIKFNQPFVDTYVNNLATNAVNNIMAEWNNPFGRGF
jgi:DNA-directed RNA polymerase subunit F